MTARAQKIREASPAQVEEIEQGETGFGAEFRGQARQRRFKRSDGAVASETSTATPKRRKTSQERLSDDPHGMLTELSRMADRVIETRERVGAERSRADHAERQLQETQSRIVAAKGLVYEAQRTARIATERCSFLEGRCEALETALDQALSASMVQRWKWRRAFRKQLP